MSRERRRLCAAVLVALGFALGCSEFVVIGIESDLARGLGVSLQTAGQLISVYSLCYAVLTPVLALSTGRFRRYQLLVAYCALFCVGNLVSAVATSFGILLVSRVLLGGISGALLAVEVTYIPELVGPRRTSILVAIIYGAYSVAMVLVTSVGKIVADTVGWHWAMYGTLVLSLLAAGAALALLPRRGTTDGRATFREQIGLVREPSVLMAMLIFLFGIGSVYVFYGYVTPYLEQVIGLDTLQASTTLMAYGCFCLVSNVLGGWIDMRFGIRVLVVTFLAQAAILLGLFVAGSTMPQTLVLVFAVAVIMYVSEVPCVSVFIRMANRLHPKSLTLASSLEPMAFNVGIAFGTAVGGVVVAGPGIGCLGLVGAAFSLIACVFVELTYRATRRRLSE